MLLKERYADIMWKKSRLDAGKSQQYMAERLGVSRTTIQHWEEGYTNPGSDNGFKWFEILGVQPLSYYIQAIYDFDTADIDDMDEKEINKLLCDLITAFPITEKVKLLYCLTSCHGANPIAKINLLYANDLVPLRDRINVAQAVYNNYEIAKGLNQIPGDAPIDPDMNLLDIAISDGKDAVINGKDTYSTKIDGLVINI